MVEKYVDQIAEHFFLLPKSKANICFDEPKKLFPYILIKYRFQTEFTSLSNPKST